MTHLVMNQLPLREEAEMSTSQVLEQFAQVSDRKCHEDVNLDKVLTRYFTGKKFVLA